MVFGLEGHKGCKVAANIIHGFDCIFQIYRKINFLATYYS